MTSLLAHGGNHWNRSNRPPHWTSVGSSLRHSSNHWGGHCKSRAYRFWNSGNDCCALSANFLNVKDKSLPVLQFRMGIFFFVLNSMRLSIPKLGTPFSCACGQVSNLSKSAITNGCPSCNRLVNHSEKGKGLPS
jgi:hypothetical protein